MTEQRLGHDLAYPQAWINWDLVAADPAFDFGIAKCTQGTWEDNRHQSHIKGLEAHGKPFTEYLLHDTRFAVRNQFAAYVKYRIGGVIQDALDLEWMLKWSQLEYYLKEGANRWGRKWLLYSNYNILNQLYPYREEILKYADIWLAWPWRNHAAALAYKTPTVWARNHQAGVKVKVWQYSWYYVATDPGKAWLVRGKLDGDRFEGTEAEWQEFIDGTPPAPLTLEERVARLETFH